MLHYVSTGIRTFHTNPVVPFRRPYWEFYAVLHGQIAPWMEPPQPLQSSTLWLFPAHQNHGWKGEPKKGARIAVFHYDGVPEALERLTRRDGFARIPLRPADCTRLYQAAKGLIPRLHPPSPSFEFHAQRTLMDLAVLFLDHAIEAPTGEEASPPGSPLALVQLAENWFRDHLAEQPTLVHLSCATGLSERYLRRLFHTVHQCGPKAIMSRIQMNHVVHLLTTTDLKLEAIATECGFASTSHFFKAFKRVQGLTPSDFRKARQVGSGPGLQTVRRLR